MLLCEPGSIGRTASRAVYLMVMEPVDFLDRAVVARIPALVKARMPDSSGRRIVEIESSNEQRDFDGDVVLQKALLDSAASFIATGHLDIDHKSEFGMRLGIPDPASYIVGRPLEVTKGPDGRTFVTGQIAKSREGVLDTAKHRYDELWEALSQEPPVVYYASIYGFPTDYDTCGTNPQACAAVGATRLVIKAIDWRSLAFTRTPKNTSIQTPVRIISAKAYIAELAKDLTPAPTIALPNTMQDVWAQHKDCPQCGVGAVPSLLGYKQHFAKCCGMPEGPADVNAHAMMYRRMMDKYLGPQRTTAPETVI
jgi:hypothetical protein